MTTENYEIMQHNEISAFAQKIISNVRDDMRNNPYIEEAIRVLPVSGYRSAIGAFWNAVVDDLRRKIIFRSLSLFNSEMNIGREIKTYEDFQNFVNDDQLIEGAYKIGVIGWEALKVLRHSKETRHIFSGHPESSAPSPLKVFSFMEDCIKYVINEEYPAKIIDIHEYIRIMGSPDYDRNTHAIENAIGDLPEIYKKQLIHQLFTIYVNKESPTILISNIEYVAPILWKYIIKEIKIEVIRRVDSIYVRGDATETDRAFKFAVLVEATPYLSSSAKKYKIEPVIDLLYRSLDNWNIENSCVEALLPYASVIPIELHEKYVSALTQTYVGQMGSSRQFSRTDFYADYAALIIPKMFQSFDDNLASAFVACLRQNTTLKSRLSSPSKMRRLRGLAVIIKEKISDSFSERHIIDLLLDEQKTHEFLRAIT